jgi:hypothetical protein
VKPKTNNTGMLASTTLENARDPPPMKISFIIYALLISSDPVISSLRCSLKEAVQLLHKDEIDYENHE